MKKLVGLLLSGILVLSAGASVFAEDVTTDTTPRQGYFRSTDKSLNRFKMGEGMQKFRGMGHMANDTCINLLAELTDKTSDEIKALIDDDTNIFDIAEDEGVLDELKEQLAQKQQEAMLEGLKTRLDAGTITQEQYDTAVDNMNKRIATRGIWRDYKDANANPKEKCFELIAELTGKTTDEIAELSKDRTAFRKLIVDEGIATELGEKLRSNAIEAKTDYLKEKLADGEITQEQYDYAIELMESRPVKMHMSGRGAGKGSKGRGNGSKRVIDSTNAAEEL